MTDRLYGIPGAEELDDELGGAYERNDADYGIEQLPDGGVAFLDHDPSNPFTIEEWSATTLTDHIARQAPGQALHILDRLVEQFSEDIGLEGAYDHIVNAGNHDDVRAAFVAAIHLFASKCGGYSMADKLLHTYTITWDADGEPLADGQPIYRPRGDGQ